MLAVWAVGAWIAQALDWATTVAVLQIPDAREANVLVQPFVEPLWLFALVKLTGVGVLLLLSLHWGRPRWSALMFKVILFAGAFAAAWNWLLLMVYA